MDVMLMTGSVLLATTTKQLRPGTVSSTLFLPYASLW